MEEKFNAYVKLPIQLNYAEFFRTVETTHLKFAAIYIPSSTELLKPIKSGASADGKGARNIVHSILMCLSSEEGLRDISA